MRAQISTHPRERSAVRWRQGTGVGTPGFDNACRSGARVGAACSCTETAGGRVSTGVLSSWVFSWIFLVPHVHGVGQCIGAVSGQVRGRRRRRREGERAREGTTVEAAMGAGGGGASDVKENDARFVHCTKA